MIYLYYITVKLKGNVSYKRLGANHLKYLSYGLNLSLEVEQSHGFYQKQDSSKGSLQGDGQATGYSCSPNKILESGHLAGLVGVAETDALGLLQASPTAEPLCSCQCHSHMAENTQKQGTARHGMFEHSASHQYQMLITRQMGCCSGEGLLDTKNLLSPGHTILHLPRTHDD